MTDLPERLRAIAETVDDWNAPIMAKDDLTRAADEIERLRAWIRDRRANVEQIAKDHRAMEAAESMKGQMMTIQYDDRFGWSVACGFIMCRYGPWQPTLADAILAAEAAQKD
jgi:hypothetical protein